MGGVCVLSYMVSLKSKNKAPRSAASTLSGYFSAVLQEQPSTAVTFPPRRLSAEEEGEERTK